MMALPMPSEKNAVSGSTNAPKSMAANLLHSMARKKTLTTGPLPPRNGLGATRARVPEGQGMKAADFIWHLVSTQRHRHPDDNVDAVLARFTEGAVVKRDGSPLTPETWLEPGTDVFFYRRPAPEKPVPFEITTVFEDDDLLVVDKPPFMATMPRASHITETATVRLRRVTGNEELTPAHRLDRATSGLLLLTKRREIRGAYQELFARREVRKEYEAIALLHDVPPAAPWHHHLTKQPGEPAARLVPGAEPNASTVVASVSRIEPALEVTLQKHYGVSGALGRYVLQPETGRTHQLRVQMMTEAAPILGDRIYPTLMPADTEDFSVPMLLRCTALEFTDPLSGSKREFRLSETWPTL